MRNSILIVNERLSELQTVVNTNQIYQGVYDVNEIGNSFQKLNFDNIIVDVTALKNYQDVNTIKQLTNYIATDKIIVFLNNLCVGEDYLSELVSMGVYNFTNDTDGIKDLLSRPNTFKDVAGYQKNSNSKLESKTQVSAKRHCKVIGVENVTKHAGASSLIYSLVKNLKKKYNVIGIEVDSTDFAFFHSKQLISTISNKVRFLVDQNANADIIFIDINGSSKALEICDEVIYLVEPTTIKINKLILSKPTIFQELFDKKIVLNRCALDKWEIAEFENEARVKVFYAIPLINDRNDKEKSIIDFLAKLGFKV